MSSATSLHNIPSHKTVLDAYNGYHQVPLDKESVKLKTFITEYGRHQYLRVPQGHTSSGDAYTRRYDDIIADVPRKHKITDDVLLDDTGIEASFWHAFDLLVLFGKMELLSIQLNFCLQGEMLTLSDFMLVGTIIGPLMIC